MREEEAKRQIESGGAAIWLTLSFRLKPEQQAATKTFLTGWGNEMFTVRGLIRVPTWDVRMHLFRLSLFATDVEWAIQKNRCHYRAVKNGNLCAPPPPRLIYPICVSTHPLQFQFHTTPQISNLFCLCNAIEILSHSMPMTLSHRQKIEITFAIEIFHVYTDLTGAT